MKDIMKKVWLILFVISILATIVINLYIQFTNVDVTETRIFITYWPVFMIEVIVILFLRFMIFRKK